MAGDRPPYVRMEVAFGIDPLTRPAAGDWVSVGVLTVGGEAVTVGGEPVYVGDGARLRIHRLKTQRGGNVRTGEIETGEATVEIDDLDGVLDPSNAASPFSPDVKLRTRVRFVVGPSNGDEFVAWTGFFNRMPIRWRRMLARTTLTASGLLWLAGDINLPPSVLHQTIVDLEPVAYWPLTEDSGRVADDIAGVADGSYRQSLTDTRPLVPFDGRTAPKFKRPDDNDAVGQAMTAGPVNLPGGGFGVSLWWSSPNGPTAGVEIPAFIILSPSGDPTARPRLMMTISRKEATLSPNGDSIRIYVQTASTQNSTQWPAHVPLFDGAPHHFAINLDASGNGEVWVDGVALTAETPPFDTDLDSTAMALVTQMTTTHVGWGVSVGSGALDHWAHVGHVAFWDRELTAGEVGSIFTAGSNPWAGDLTGTRLGRVLDLCGIDAGDRDIDAGTVACGPTNLDSQSLTDYLRKIAATEGGTIYEDAAGRIAFRQHVTNDPTPEVTFSDDPDGDSGSAVGPVEPDYSTDRLINVAEVVRESGVSQLATDLASRTQYGPKTVTIDTLHQTPSGARGRANELVYRNNEPRLIFRNVDAHYLDTALATMTSLDVQDAAEIIVRPPRGGDPIQQTTLVERVTHRFERDWVASFGLVQHIVLPWFSWDTTDAGWDQSAWSTTS